MNDANPAPVSVASKTAATSDATAGFRRHHRTVCSVRVARRARIGSSARNRPRSSPSASADGYRVFGSFSIAFKTIVSRSRGIRASMARGRSGSSPLICSISLSRSAQSNPGRRVSSS